MKTLSTYKDFSDGMSQYDYIFEELYDILRETYGYEPTEKMMDERIELYIEERELEKAGV